MLKEMNLEDLQHKNVLLVIGRGIEACGVTRFTIELEEWLKSAGHNVKVLAGNDKKWGREKAQPNDFEKHAFKSGVWSDGVDYDMCIITSVPPKKIDKDEAISKVIYDNFIETLKRLNTRLVYLQCDNKIHSINRNFYADEAYMHTFFSLLDRIIVHNLNADFVKRFIDKHHLRDNKFTLGQQVLISTDFDEIASQITKADKVDKTCWFIGRSAQWKGWREFRDFHTTTLRANGYTSVIEGIELSINAKQDMSNIDENNVYTWRDDNIYYGVGNDITPDTVINNINDFRDKPSLIFGPYIRLDALNRMHRSKFGMFFTFTGPEFGGQIEITFLEIVGAGTVPVIRKELWDNAFFNDVYLKDLGTPEDLGIVVYDSNKKEECLELLNKLNSDGNLYDSYLEKALAFCKSQFDRKYIINRLFEKCLSDDDDERRDKQISLWW